MQALLRSPRHPEILCAPGNAGIASQVRVLDVAADDVERVVRAAAAEAVDLVLVGPEAPLVAGVADALETEGIRCFGPSKAASALEGSKSFCKEVMAAAGVATASYQTVTDPASGMAAIERYPVVIKADGLAAGKGVVVAQEEAQARRALDRFLVEHQFGSERVVVEEHLEGEELSLLAFCDGRRALPLASAQDYKRIFDGDRGPNTGGMGSYSPVPAIGHSRASEIAGQVHQPVLDELARRGTPFRGVLYAGLMMTADGPRVLEFNVRFGDPETQAILPRLRTDLLIPVLAAVSPEGLDGIELEWTRQTAVTVVMASAGYPETSSSGQVITGLDALPGDVYVTHAGTSRSSDGAFLTAGGRVLAVTGLGADAVAGRDAAYAAADMIDFEGKQLRRDIALRAAQ